MKKKTNHTVNSLHKLQTRRLLEPQGKVLELSILIWFEIMQEWGNKPTCTSKGLSVNICR